MRPEARHLAQGLRHADRDSEQVGQVLHAEVAPQLTSRNADKLDPRRRDLLPLDSARAAYIAELRTPIRARGQVANRLDDRQGRADMPAAAAAGHQYFDRSHAPILPRASAEGRGLRTERDPSTQSSVLVPQSSHQRSSRLLYPSRRRATTSRLIWPVP